MLVVGLIIVMSVFAVLGIVIDICLALGKIKWGE
jgi:hypothetical protein